MQNSASLADGFDRYEFENPIYRKKEPKKWVSPRNFSLHNGLPNRTSDQILAGAWKHISVDHQDHAYITGHRRLGAEVMSRKRSP